MSRFESIWLDIRTGLDELFLQEYYRPYTTAIWSCNDQEPQIIAFVGHASKNTAMYELFSLNGNCNDSKIYLRLVPATEAAPSPVLIADCELHDARRLERVLGGPVPADIDQRSIVWHKRELSSHDPRAVANLVYARLVFPFCSAICIFADDIGNTRSVARMLAAWLRTDRPRHRLSARPRTLVLVRLDKSSTFDEELATTAFIEELRQEVERTGLRPAELLREHFDGLRVLALPVINQDGHAAQDSWTALRARILRDAAEVQELRRTARMAFSALHLKSLIHSACDHFAADFTTPFCLLAASRHKNPVSPVLAKHLANFLRLAYQVSPSSVSDFAVPVIASALVLDSYPPRHAS